MTPTTLRPQLRSALLQQLRSSSSAKQSALARGFTLVELMVVIVIVGILSAVALPQFLGVKDKAKLNTQIGEGSGLAKECSAAIISESPYPGDYVLTAGKTVTGLSISGNCNGGDTTKAPGSDIVYSTDPVPEAAAGAKCGTTVLAKDNVCKITVTAATGAITYGI